MCTISCDRIKLSLPFLTHISILKTGQEKSILTSNLETHLEIPKNLESLDPNRPVANIVTVSLSYVRFFLQFYFFLAFSY